MSNKTNRAALNKAKSRTVRNKTSEQATTILAKRDRMRREMVEGAMQDTAEQTGNIDIIDVVITPRGAGVQFNFLVNSERLRARTLQDISENVETNYSTFPELSWDGQHPHRKDVDDDEQFAKAAVDIDYSIRCDYREEFEIWSKRLIHNQGSPDATTVPANSREIPALECEFVSSIFDLAETTTGEDLKQAVVPAMNRHIMALTHFDEESAQDALSNELLTEETREHVLAHSVK